MLLTAQKIADSKASRLGKVGSDLKKQMTDLEQRAKKTSVMNSERLKEMVPKSKQKQVDASEARSLCFQRLMELSTSSSAS